MPSCDIYEQRRELREKVMYGTFSSSKRLALEHRYRGRGVHLRFEPKGGDPR